MNKVRHTIHPFFDLLPYLVLFSLLFIFFGFFADHVGYYLEKTSLFVFSCDYLSGYLRQPGSPLIYISNLVTSFFHLRFAGAIVMPLIVCLTVYFISKILHFLSGKKAVLIPFFSGAGLFYFQSDYQFLLYHSIALLLELTFFHLALRYLKGWLPVVIFPFLYLLTGAFAWIFLLMYTLYILTSSIRQDWLKIVTLWAAIPVMIYVLKEYFLFQTAQTLMTFPFSENGAGFQSEIFIGFLVFITILPLVAKINFPLFRRVRIGSLAEKTAPTLLVLVVFILVSIYRSDKTTRNYFIVEKLFCRERFNEVIEFNEKNPSVNLLTIYLNNIALCETGKLNDQLFHTRQDPGGQTLFLKWEMSGEILRRGGYFYYTTGMINEAHRWAYENMIMKGITPDDLKMLIKTEIINGNYEIAEKYILILEKTLFHRKEALSYRALLYDDAAVDSDPRLGVRRREKIRTDFFSITDDPYTNIERILAADPLNRKAFEYKLAFMLLKKDYAGIEAQLQELGKYGFTRIPVHIEEAAEAYKVLNLGPLPEQGELPFNPRTALRFNQFLLTFQQYGNNLKSAEPALREKFGNTFWYYSFYR